MADRQLPLIPFHGAAIFNLPSLIVAVVLALAGCAAPHRAPEPPPPIQLSESTRWQIDSDIGAASLAATGPAKNYARGAIEDWKTRVSRQSETEFIPWFGSYWTQQWLTIKMTWYTLNAQEGTDTAVTRLATYLQEQFQDRVLKPIAKEIDPDVVRERATKLYIQSLREQLRGIPPRYGVPQDPFDRRLKEIPAIALAPPPAHNATLFQLIHADPVASLPAYKALMAQIRKDAGDAASGLLNVRISPMARRASEKLADKLASSGGASAASAIFRGIAGTMISLGAAGFGAIAHEQERPGLEAQLRENLNTALDEMSFGLMEDRATGVMAGVYYISGRIEESIPKVVTHPIMLDVVPRAVPLSGE